MRIITKQRSLISDVLTNRLRACRIRNWEVGKKRSRYDFKHALNIIKRK